jgi:hypothetical protein
MQDDQIGRKFIGLATADMARLPHLINTKKNNLVRQLDNTFFELALLYKGNRPFLNKHSPSSS